MGLFSSSKSSTTSNLNQQDNRQTVTDQGQALRSDGGGVLLQGGSAPVASIKESGNSTILIQDFNKEFAAKTLDEIIGSTQDSIVNTLGFADDIVSMVFDSQRENLTVANNQLEETRDFAASLIQETSETADDRLGKFSSQTFIILAVLFGLVIWRS